MHALLGAYGTRGDLQPTLALGLGLRAAGHEVTVCAPINFRAWVERLRFRYHPCDVDIEAFLNEVELGILRSTRVLPQHTRRQFASMSEIARDADIFVGAGMNAAGQSIAERWGIPYRFIAFSPILIPSREYPSLAIPWQTLPKWMNALTWRINDFAWSYVFRDTVNDERAKLGLPPVADTWRTALGESVLVASDPVLGEIPSDATHPALHLGAFFMPEQDELDPEIEAFLADGSPPVYVGFGSMTDPNPTRTSRIIVEAIEAAGVRALISKGWSNLGGQKLPPQIKLIGPAPHGKLFPRMAAVVHHGGAGTTHAALRGGVPQVIVPHLLDQYYWAHRVWQQGLGPKSFAKDKLTVDALAEVIDEAVSSRSYRDRSRALQKQLVTNGVERAVAELERVVGRRAAPQLRTAG